MNLPRLSSPLERLYFLTNRMNLNGVLSSRLVAPRDSFQKYYTDLLQQTPGWVPLLRDAPTSAQIQAVTSERGAGAPVVVEFPLDVPGKVKSDAPVVYVPAVALVGGLWRFTSRPSETCASAELGAIATFIRTTSCCG